MGGLFTLLFYGIFIVIAIAASNSKKSKEKKYEQAKKAYSQDCKQFDNITSLNDDKYAKLKQVSNNIINENTIVQNEAIKNIVSKRVYDDVINDGHGEDDPIKEYKGFFRRLSNKELK